MQLNPRRRISKVKSLRSAAVFISPHFSIVEQVAYGFHHGTLKMSVIEEKMYDVFKD